ncbi:hypothetical protein [Amycolatopsis sp. Hca4]|uniref:hypothetical protein n=1 Tax=Amycolatopsis sp. Hca4 TaxID=2742131 RepID=UPI001590D149|nr:hypothetical protein [Amycolatopsis sp. Hca4]QKV78972.1 hypothetical protein HUT10_38280 [Amycolatopsis sp. Hca4]
MPPTAAVTSGRVHRNAAVGARPGQWRSRSSTRPFMGRGTGKTHLAHVYAKPGIANRTELATLAAACLT